jgi:sulfur carrier protein
MTTLVLNGERREVADGSTVGDVVGSLTAEQRGVAVALDGEVVPRSDWSTTRPAEGQQVEVLRAVQGG